MTNNQNSASSDTTMHIEPATQVSPDRAHMAEQSHDPNNTEQLALYYLAQCGEQLGAGDLDRGIPLFFEAARIAPSALPLSLIDAIGNLCLTQQRADQAERCAQLALSLSPDHLPAHLLHVGAVSCSNREAAISELEILSQRYPENAALLSCSGELLVSVGRSELGIARLSQAVSLLARDDQACIQAKMQLAVNQILAGMTTEGASLFLEIILQEENNLPRISEVSDRIAPTGALNAVLEEWEVLLRDRPFVLADILDKLCAMSYVNGWAEEAAIIGERVWRWRKRLAVERNVDKIPCEFILPDYIGGMGSLSLLGSQVKLRLLGWDPTQIVFLGEPEKTVNPALLRYYQRYISVVSEPETVAGLAESVGRVLTRRTLYDMHEGRPVRKDLELYALAEEEWRRRGNGPLLELTEEHREMGWEYLSRFGIRPGDWFAAIHVRENLSRRDDTGWSIRDVRDISSYYSAISRITSRGGWVIRMGDASMTPLPPMNRVIDIATAPDQTDWLNVFLWASGRFFLGVNSGPLFVPIEFGVPTIACNWVPFYVPPPEMPYIPKLYRSTSQSRLLRFPELLRSRIGKTESSYTLKSLGAELVDNTEDEVADLVDELLDSLEGIDRDTAEDRSRRARFEALFSANGLRCVPRIGRSFLAKYEALLDG